MLERSKWTMMENQVKKIWSEKKATNSGRRLEVIFSFLETLEAFVRHLILSIVMLSAL